MKNKYDINDIFDSTNNFITNKLDYEIQPNIDYNNKVLFCWLHMDYLHF